VETERIDDRMVDLIVEELEERLDLVVASATVDGCLEANRRARQIQAGLPPDHLERLERAWPSDSDELVDRLAATFSTFPPDLVNAYGDLLELVAEVVDRARDGSRIAALEARILELETMIAGAGAVLAAAEVD